jgi:cell division topological specificity factor
MSIFDIFRTNKKTSASVAKERLQIIVAHQRGKNDDFLPLLQKELIQVISKYVKIDQDQVKVELDKNGDTSVLELNIVLPNRALERDSSGRFVEEKSLA